MPAEIFPKYAAPHADEVAVLEYPEVERVTATPDTLFPELSTVETSNELGVSVVSISDSYKVAAGDNEYGGAVHASSTS